MFSKYRKLTKLELQEIQELTRIASAERFKAVQLKNNSIAFTHFKDLLKNQEAMAELMEAARQNYVYHKLTELGYASDIKTSLNLETGEIKIEK